MDLIRRTHTVVPFLVALVAAGHDFGLQLTNGFHVTYKATKRSLGLVKLEAWRNRTTAAIARAVSAGSSWMLMLLQLRVPALCALAVILALLVADLSAAHAAGIATAIAVPVATITTVEQLRAERAQLFGEAEALSGADGKFETEAARAAGDNARSDFDVKMKRVAEIDTRIKELEKPAAPTSTTPAGDEAARAAGAQAERARVTGITEAVRIAKLDAGVSADMVQRGITLDQARAEILTRLASQSDEHPTHSQIRTNEDAFDKFKRGATNWLLVKGGMAETVARAENPTAPNIAAIDPGEFRGMTLVDMARHCLERARVKTVGIDKMKLVSMAFMQRDATQSTSDFAVLLENVMHKILQAAYGTVPDTWSAWCGRGSVSDFRAHNRYRMGSFGSLDAVGEDGEFKNKAIQDGEKATITAGTKGNIINVSRQMIINDDMGSFTRLLSMLGRAAGLSVEVDAYALLGQNAGLGPNQADGQPLFHANRANVGAGAAISAASLDADAAVMSAQKDPNGNEFLDLQPDVLLVPRGLRGQANVINESQFDPDTLANKAQMKPNVARGFFRTIVGTPRLAGVRRYMFANPAIAPVFEVAFLEGQESPVLETQDGWRSDGAEMKVRFDYGVAAVDFRGSVTNAGV